MDYSLYLFDFDYTLANSEKGIVMCFQHVFKTNGVTGISDERIKRTIGLTLEQAFMELAGVEDQDTLKRYRKEYVEKADQVMVENTKIYKGVIPTLQQLKAQGASIGIISTKYRYRIEESISIYKMEPLVDIIIGGSDVEDAKPSPEGIEKAITYFDVKKEQILYVGDSIVDAKTAYNASVDFAAVTTGTTREEDFMVLPHVKIMKNIEEITS